MNNRAERTIAPDGAGLSGFSEFQVRKPAPQVNVGVKRYLRVHRLSSVTLTVYLGSMAAAADTT